MRGLRVGVPKEYFVEGMEAGVEAAVRSALDVLRANGAELVEVSLPHTKYALPVYYIIAPAEASANLARYDGVRYGVKQPGESYWDELEARAAGFGAEVRRRIMLGTYALRPATTTHITSAPSRCARSSAATSSRPSGAGRHPGRAHRTDRGVQDRRENRRPAGDVP